MIKPRGAGCSHLSPVQDYLLKIIDTPGLLKPEQVSALFGNIESIYALNRYVLGLCCLGAWGEPLDVWTHGL